MTGYLLVLPIMLLVLLQGGFFAFPTCAVGIVTCAVAAIAWFRKPRRRESLPLVPVLFLLVAVAYLISSLANGLTHTTLSQTSFWAACAGMAFLAATQSKEQRDRSMTTLACFGVLTAIAGSLVAAGIIPIVDGMVEDRLQFTFQYANAAGVWYGVCFFVCLFSRNRNLAYVSLAPFCALLLTESAGTVLAMLLASVAVAVALAKVGDWDMLRLALLQGVCGTVAFVICRLVPAPASAVVLPICTLAVWYALKRLEGEVPRVDSRVFTLVLAAVLLVAIVVFAIVFRERVGEAIVSVRERLAQAADGLSAWCTSPLLGVGPDNWQYVYRDHQTSVYYVTVVHSSYVQILLDAGIVGLAAFVGACVVGMRSLVKAIRLDDVSTLLAPCATALLLIHSLIEFDLRFSSILMLLAFLLCESEGMRVRPVRGFVAGILSVACIPLCVLGLVCAISTFAMDLAAASGDYAECVQMYSSDGLATNDPGAKTTYIAACYSASAYEQVTKAYEGIDSPSDKDAYCAARAYYEMGNQEAAGEALVGYMERRPYDVDFVDIAQSIVDEYGIPFSLRSRFDNAVQVSTSLAAFAGSGQ